MHTEPSSSNKTSSNIAAIVAGLTLPVAVYVAFWQIDWQTSNDSLLRYILPVAFCVIAPSFLGSIVAALTTSRDPQPPSQLPSRSSE